MHRRAAALAFCLLAGSGAAQTPAPPNGDPVPAPESSPVLELFFHRPLIALIAAPDTELAAFTTDGCSGGMSDGWVTLASIIPDLASEIGTTPPWEPCCITHDRAYHNAGGARTAPQSALARLHADEDLRACVLTWAEPEAARMNALYGTPEVTVTTAYAGLASAMFNAVRLGGAPCSIWSWRWGYGYPTCSLLD